MSNVLKVSLLTIFFFSILALGIVWRACSVGTAIVDKVVDPDNVIYNYEYFKRSYQDIKALEAKITTAEVDLKNFRDIAGAHKEMDRDDKAEEARLRTILFGLKNQRETQRAEYNARAQMANRNLFKTGDLPDYIR